ncbi:MAG: hypothetical protein JW955_18120 [Sedimentisphaerales bacterium]|nr:hypothetical protein [Sedimentisphaerales bacterium]
MSPDGETNRLMNAQEYLAYLVRKFQQDMIATKLKDSLDAQVRREGKPFVSFGVTQTSGEEVVAEALQRPTLILSRLQSALSGSDLALPRSPVLGYLPIRNLNAVSTLAPNGEPIILLDQMLRSILHTFASCLIHLGVEVRKRGGWLNVPEATLLTTSRGIAASIRLFLRDSGGDEDMRAFWRCMLYDVPPEIPETGDVLCDVVVIFILSHEYAHHILGHVRPSAIQQCEISEGQPSLALVVASRAKEKAADQLALQIFLTCFRPDSDLIPFQRVEHFAYAPLLFFDIMSTVEATRRFSERKVRLHPPASERKQLLWDRVMSSLDERRKEDYEFFSSFLGICRERIISLGL